MPFYTIASRQGRAQSEPLGIFERDVEGDVWMAEANAPILRRRTSDSVLAIVPAESISQMDASGEVSDGDTELADEDAPSPASTLIHEEHKHPPIKVRDFAYPQARPSPSPSTGFTVSHIVTRPATEIWNPRQALSEADFRFSQNPRTKAVLGRNLRRLLDIGWLTMDELKAKGHPIDFAALAEHDARPLYPWRPISQFVSIVAAYEHPGAHPSFHDGPTHALSAQEIHDVRLLAGPPPSLVERLAKREETRLNTTIFEHRQALIMADAARAAREKELREMIRGFDSRGGGVVRLINLSGKARAPLPAPQGTPWGPPKRGSKRQIDATQADRRGGAGGGGSKKRRITPVEGETTPLPGEYYPGAIGPAAIAIAAAVTDDDGYCSTESSSEGDSEANPPLKITKLPLPLRRALRQHYGYGRAPRERPAQQELPPDFLRRALAKQYPAPLHTYDPVRYPEAARLAAERDAAEAEAARALAGDSGWDHTQREAIEAGKERERTVEPLPGAGKGKGRQVRTKGAPPEEDDTDAEEEEPETRSRTGTPALSRQGSEAGAGSRKMTRGRGLGRTATLAEL